MDELNSIGNIEASKYKNNPIVKGAKSIYMAGFYFTNFYSDSEVNKFIKNTEKLIRTSREYSTYIELLRNTTHALNRDSVQGNITTVDVDLEFHHYPITLYDIVEIVMMKNALDKKEFNTFTIAKEVMELHYKNMIGLVSLTKTNHELAHENALFLSTKQIFGDWEKFIAEYKPAVTPEILSKCKLIKEHTEKNTPSNFKGVL